MFVRQKNQQYESSDVLLVIFDGGGIHNACARVFVFVCVRARVSVCAH